MKDKFNPNQVFICPDCKKQIPLSEVFESITLSYRNPQINAECPFCSKILSSLAYRDSNLIKEILIAFVNWELQKLAELRDKVVKEK